MFEHWPQILMLVLSALSAVSLALDAITNPPEPLSKRVRGIIGLFSLAVMLFVLWSGGFFNV